MQWCSVVGEFVIDSFNLGVKMVRSCCVIGCNRKSHDNKGQKPNYGDRFFSFPTLKKGQRHHVADVAKRRRIAGVAGAAQKHHLCKHVSFNVCLLSTFS